MRWKIVFLLALFLTPASALWADVGYTKRLVLQDIPNDTLFYSINGTYTSYLTDGSAMIYVTNCSTTPQQMYFYFIDHDTFGGAYLENGTQCARFVSEQGGHYSYSPVTISSLLYKYMPLDYQGGATHYYVKDFSQNHYNGESGGVNSVVAGSIGNEFDFSWTVQAGNAYNSIGSGNFTMCMWFKPESDNVSDYLWGHGYPFTPIPYYYRLWIETTGKLAMNFYKKTPVGTFMVETDAAYAAANVRHHLCFERTGPFDGDFYIDGVKVNSTNSSSGTAIALDSDVYFLGGWPTPSSGLYDGHIDDFQVWSEALSASQIYDIYNTTAIRAGSVQSYNSTPPSITIISIGEDTTYPFETKDSTPMVNATTVAAADCRASIDGDESYDNMADDIACSGTTSHSCQFGHIADGNVTFYVACMDSYYFVKNTAANNAAQWGIVHADAPIITILSTQNTSISTTSHTFSVSTNNAANCSVWYDGSWHANATSGTSHTWPAVLAEGNHTGIYYKCEDTFNSNTSSSYDYWLNVAIPPVITINNPENLTWIVSSFTFNVSTDETANCSVWYGGSWHANTTVGTEFTWVETLADGNYTVFFRCEDTFGNAGNSYSFWLDVDAFPPLVTIISAQNMTIGVSHTFEISVDEPSNCSVWYSGSWHANALGDYTWAAVLPGGNISGIYYQCMDAGGWSADTYDYWLFVDNVSPAITWDWVDINSTLPSSTTSPCLNTSETASCQLTLNGVHALGSGTHLCHSVTFYVAGNYSASATCTDLYGNVGYASVAWAYVNLTAIFTSNVTGTFYTSIRLAAASAAGSGGAMILIVIIAAMFFIGLLILLYTGALWYFLMRRA